DLRIFPVPPPASGFGPRLRSIRQPHSYLFSDDLRQALDDELARGFDVLHLEQTWAGWVGLEHAARSVLNVHYLFTIDRGNDPIRSPLDLIRGRLSLRAEPALLRRYPTITPPSPRLTERRRDNSRKSRVHTVPLDIHSALSPSEPP